MKRHKLPKDLGVRFGTKDQALWERVEKETKIMIEQLSESLQVQKGILEYARLKIEEEKATLK